MSDAGSPLGVRVRGPLARYADGLYAALAQQGYTNSSAAEQLRLLSHLSRWLEEEGLTAGELMPEALTRFLQARRRSHAHLVSERALRPMVTFLRSVGAVPEAPIAVAETEVDVLVDGYRRYLIHERGLAPGTVGHHERVARLFLSRLGEPVDVDLEGLSAAEVSRFVLRECPGRSVSVARNVVSGTRSLLRFLYLDGRIPRPLASAVPGVAGWSMSGLPRAVSPETAARLVASCDQDRAVGRRDRAVLVLLCRLGLRAHEVTRMELGDIDWRAGEVLIRGKGDRNERLPVPVDVGEALVGYLQDGRPRSSSRRVFLSARAPVGEVSASAVRSVVRDACRRAALPVIGAHRLRHMVGTEALRSGASLAEVGQLLRQRSPLTTANYAKVDRLALGALARPWPGVVA